MTDISPAEKIIEALGGLSKTARLLSTDDKDFAISTVQGWKERKRIPQDYWERLIAVGKVAGVEITADMLLGLAEVSA
ncbi:hypothetical protein SJ05684_c10270 [Sinorhizobium sojae CCBAU 05684]|uniref:Uncharacterized protein n=1 Tax=Sinorhizobium sojae CCBAU 05684 TaxID=716928 RepID=A0A249P9M7_9HYPH|nr:hypothetical protein [Sinorhizobium sojae]ASY62485.1 hypothetical protein SJ05684_c10270 [Sinorhizobium sojae CCBAU 05684]